MPQTERPLTDYALSPLVEVLARQWISRWDMYPQQLRHGRWRAVHEPLHVGLLLAHLRGEVTLGTYALNPGSRGRFLVLDADDAPTWQGLQVMAHSLWQQGVVSYLEGSRRGGHLWLFFDRRHAGVDIRLFGHGLLARYNLNPSEVELFPKQDELSDGPGSLIRLPFGIHRKSGRRYGFTLPDGRPLAPTLRQQLQLLGGAETVPKRLFTSYLRNGREVVASNRKQLLLPPQSGIETAMGDGPVSQRIKAAVSVRDFVAQYVELNERGQGRCPFHDDRHPSFSVNEAENYWHCFSCGIGGSLIDFAMHWHGWDFKTAVAELAKLLL